MGSLIPWLVGIAVALFALAAIASCVVGKEFDRGFDDDWTPTREDLQASREQEKAQLIVTAMKRDREAAFAAHTGSAFGEVPRVPREGA